MGVHGAETDEIFGDPDVTAFLGDARKRLIIAAEIVRQIRRATMHISATLEVDWLGRIVSGSQFRSRECIYPVGYGSRRNFGAWMGGVPDGWYRCEVQSAFVRPVFVIRDPREDAEEIVALTPDAAVAALLARYGGGDAAGKGELAFGLTASEIVGRINEMAEESAANDDSDSDNGG
jgi:hypothetical protein